MSSKHLESILEVLKKSGPLPSSDLKQLVMNKMQLEEDEYRKSTYHNHLDKLFKDKKIAYKVEENKRIYFIPKYDHPVQGGLFLENLGGRIFVPELLQGFEIQINQEVPFSLSKTHFLLIFQFNSKTICLKIPKRAVPFNIHISRKKFIDEIHPQVRTIFGARTITIELPIAQLSSFPVSSINEDEKNGHALITFEDSNVIIKDLISTNPSAIAQINNLDLDTFLNEITLFSNFTIDAKFERRSSKITGKSKLEIGQSQQLELPSLILLSIDSQLGIF